MCATILRMSEYDDKMSSKKRVNVVMSNVVVYKLGIIRRGIWCQMGCRKKNVQIFFILAQMGCIQNKLLNIFFMVQMDNSQNSRSYKLLYCSVHICHDTHRLDLLHSTGISFAGKTTFFKDIQQQRIQVVKHFIGLFNKHNT